MALKTIPKKYIAVDEVGRGALAGPMIVCAFLINSKTEFCKYVKDSKKCSYINRLKVWDKYKNQSIYAFGIVLPDEIDTLGMTKATEVAIQRSLISLSNSGVDTLKFDLIIDGNFKFKFADVKSTVSVIKADSILPGVSIASIFAKVFRDNLMKNYHTIFPLYNFDSNVGYGSGFHISTIKVNSFVRIHRKLFLRKIYEKNISCR